MVAIMIWRPRGLVATRDPSVLLAGQPGKDSSSKQGRR
jgi:hypothetical protein